VARPPSDDDDAIVRLESQASGDVQHPALNSIGRVHPVTCDPVSGGYHAEEARGHLCERTAVEMTTYVALLRGINVGGNKMVAMAELRELLGAMGFADVTTLLQSGNVVLRASTKSAAKLEGLLEAEIEKHLKVNVDFHVRTSGEWQAIVDANPFAAEAKADPSHLLVTCFKRPLDHANVTALQAAITGREKLRADGRQLYMVFPDGIGTSKALTLVDKKLNAKGTGRNWNTVLKLAELCRRVGTSGRT
jgi:uncharacterized protein (DUF1697 family)